MGLENGEFHVVRFVGVDRDDIDIRDRFGPRSCVGLDWPVRHEHEMEHLLPSVHLHAIDGFLGDRLPIEDVFDLMGNAVNVLDPCREAIPDLDNLGFDRSDPVGNRAGRPDEHPGRDAARPEIYEISEKDRSPSIRFRIADANRKLGVGLHCGGHPSGKIPVSY